MFDQEMILNVNVFKNAAEKSNRHQQCKLLDRQMLV